MENEKKFARKFYVQPLAKKSKFRGSNYRFSIKEAINEFTKLNPTFRGMGAIKTKTVQVFENENQVLVTDMMGWEPIASFNNLSELAKLEEDLKNWQAV